MNLYEKIAGDLTLALKSKETERVGTLRMVRAAFQERALQKRAAAGAEVALTDEDVLEVLRKEAKKRGDSITAFTEGGRPELAEKERRELVFIQAYLPAQMSAQEIEPIVDRAIAETKAASARDMGKVMSAVMQEVKGRASGNDVQRIVKEKLNEK